MPRHDAGDVRSTSGRTAWRRGAFWSPALAQDPARGPILLAMLSLCVTCAGVVVLRWARGKESDLLVSVVQLAMSGWMAALITSRARLGQTLLRFTPYFVAVLALITLVAMQAGGSADELVHTHALLGAYLALPVVYMLFFLLRPPTEALVGSLATCAAAMALQLLMPPIFVGRASSPAWVALLTGYWHGASILLLFAVPRLRTDRELLQAVMGSAQDAMVLLAPQGRAKLAPRLSGACVAAFRVAFANAAAAQLFGLKADEYLAAGGPLGAARELHERLADAHNGQHEVTLDTRLPTLDGVRWFRVTAAPYRSGVAATFVDVTEHKETEGRAIAMALTDPLTGLANRRGFEVEAARRFAATEAGGEHLTLCYIDLDRFKEVNDSFGHVAGDELLRGVAGRLRSSVRSTDLVARMGGDEFVVLAGGLADDYVEPFFRRLHASFAAPFEVPGGRVTVRPSLGVVPRAEELVDALAAADAAMYDAKQRGGGVVLTSAPR